MQRLALTVVLSLLLAPTLAAQQQEEPPVFEEELEVSEVLLDVLVTDEQGNVIVGLDEDDFVVEEEGEPVEITDVTFYSNRRFVDTQRAAQTGDLELDQVPVDRYFIIMIHDRRIDAPGFVEQNLDAARFAKNWVTHELLANDYVAVASYDSKLKIHQDFTTDKQAASDAIDAAIKGEKTGGNWPSRQPDEGPSLTEGLPQGKQLRRQSRRFQDAVYLLAEAADDIRGRKNLVLFSPGFGSVSRTGGAYTPDPRYYPRMVRALNDSNVAVYPIDLIPSAAGGTALERDLNSSLSSIASDTGGQYYLNFNSFATPLTQVEDDNNGYYLIGFRSRHPAGETGYREVDVTTTNPQFEVRARQGYRYGEGAG